MPNGIRIVLCTAVVLVFGCARGPRTGQVEGKVTFEGGPVMEGMVTFLNPTEGGAAEALIEEAGTFKVKTPVVVGDYIVVITPLTHIVDSDPGKSPPSPMEKPAPDIPVRYRQQGSTPLRASVTEGKNHFDFDMTKKP